MMSTDVYQRPSFEKRFWKRVKKTKSGWLWIGGKSGTGYGLTFYQGKVMGAHRASYLLHKGEIPKGLDVMHSCHVRHCINPDHLSVGTRKQNVIDCVAAGRMPFAGELNNHSILKNADIPKIRKLLRQGTKNIVIAALFGIDARVISDIKHGVTWGHVK